MLESLLITLREGVEIALILGILLVYLRKNHKTDLNKAVYVGLAFSLIMSIVAAVILEKFSLDYELFEGYLMFVAAAFVTTMIVWMWRTSKHIKKEIERKVGSLVEAAHSSWKLSFGVFLFTFLMVVREGIETVIFLRAVSNGGIFSGGAVGVAIGVASAIIFGVLFIKGSLRVDIGRFLKVTAVVLLIFVAQLLVNGIHEFYELGVFPASPQMMSIVGPIVRNNLLFILAIISIPAIMFIIPGKRKVEDPTPKGQRWQLSAGVVSLSVIFFLGFDGVFAAKATVEISKPIAMKAKEGVVQIPVGELIDGHLHRYEWISSQGTHIRFFSLRTGTGSFATAFDACRACYNYGYYYMRDGELICSVCEAPSELSKLAVATEVPEEESGSMEGMGCAPLYLPSQLLNSYVVIKTSELEKKEKFFQTSLDPNTVPIMKEGM